MEQKKKTLREMNEKIEDVWDKHLPNIADKKREHIITAGMRINDGSSLRLAMGSFYTNEEYEEYKKKTEKEWKKMMKRDNKYAKKLKRKEGKKKDG